MLYPKIQTLWKRDENNKMRIIEGDFSLPTVPLIKNWVVQEKIDGTNIRIHLMPTNKPEFYGRTDESTIPDFLIKVLKEIFSEIRSIDTWLFCEGFGPKIQKYGYLYSTSPNICLFDVYNEGKWKSSSEVKEYADSFGLISAPVIGKDYTVDDIVNFILSSPNSYLAQFNNNAICPLEGIVAKTEPLLFQENQIPLYFKLKIRDYKK